MFKDVLPPFKRREGVEVWLVGYYWGGVMGACAA